MNSNTVIQVENLAKQYRLGEVSTGSLGHDLNRWWHRVRGKEDPYLKVTQTNVREEKVTTENTENTEKRKGRGSRSAFLRRSVSSVVPVSDSSSDYVWALRDINFEVKRGEVLGIIGRNGAGKSTLLKILSRVTAPTTGEVRIKGRIASLLEVGTGFHLHLTGRENIFLNGAILGMTKPEIRNKIDEIVDFSGCARYIDTPVKRYSSGMIVRLGFAVAAHLEPEILIVDEVLAVGDAEFQKKCIGKMKDVAGHGRTILFVSHNMAAVQNLCQSALWLDNGTVVHDKNSVEKVVSAYEESGPSTSGTVQFQAHHHRLMSKFQIAALEIINSEGHSVTNLKFGEAICFRLRVNSREPFNKVRLGVAVRSHGLVLTTLQSPEFDFPAREGIEIECILPGGLLRPGRFEVNLGASRPASNTGLDHIQDAATLYVSDVGVNEDWFFNRQKVGVVNLSSEWRLDA